MSTAREGTAARLVNWLRAGMPEGVARAEYMALVSVLHKELSAEEIDQVAEALMAEAYDDELITHDEIRDMIASRVHDVATEEDIEQVSLFLAKSGVHLEDGLPGAE